MWGEVVEKMGNVFIERLGEYSKKNLPLLILDSEYKATVSIWKIAGRNKPCKLLASADNFDKISRISRRSKYDSILIRQIENLSSADQKVLAGKFAEMPPIERGKFILTTVDFAMVDKTLAKAFCSIKFRFDLEENSSARAV